MRKITILMLLVISMPLVAQESGSSGLAFLKNSFGARHAAIGDMGVALSRDVSAINYNPAVIAALQRPEVQFMHNEWIQDLRSEYFGAFFRLYGIPVALGANTTTVNDIEVRTRPSDIPESKFNANFFSFSLSSGVKLSDPLFIGASAKYIYEGMFSDEAQGVGFDIGLHYLSPMKGLSFGASIKNIGSMSELRNEMTKLPSELRFGTGYDGLLSSIKSSFSAGAELLHYVESGDMHFLLGGEFMYMDFISLRAGWQTGFESKAFSTGVGIKWKTLNFDYAYVPFKLNLGNADIISIKYTF